MDNPEQLATYGARNKGKTNTQCNMYWPPLFVGTRLLSLRALLFIRATNHATARIVSSDGPLGMKFSLMSLETIKKMSGL